ncbi:MAG: glycoside hydrolase family 10 protein [Sphingomonadales bacterium]
MNRSILLRRAFLLGLLLLSLAWLLRAGTLSRYLLPAATTEFGALSSDPIRGVWITNVASSALRSKEQIQRTVSRCKQYGFNHLFVVVWNGGYTLYPSEIQKKYIGIDQHPEFLGRDPLREIISEAHAQGLKVHAWFEFGFSYAHRDSNNAWLRSYPEWVGRNNKGGLLQKNGFYWWNSLHPGPQQLLLSLVTEVVRDYAVDGIQGDDRLPAMPAEGGYDPYTLQQYAADHSGAAPPQDPRQKHWLQWKADRLSVFGKLLYDSVKSIRSDCMVSWAPSIFPWSKEEYLQDWPVWLEAGYADAVFPQLYRYNIAAYETILKQLQQQIPANKRSRVFPGILTSLGDGYQASDTLMQQFIALNRRYGFDGEVFFYYETLNRTSTPLYKKE